MNVFNRLSPNAGKTTKKLINIQNNAANNIDFDIVPPLPHIVINSSSVSLPGKLSDKWLWSRQF